MRHTLKIGVAKTPPDNGSNRADRIVSCRHVTVREKLIRFLFGAKQRLTVIVPGDSVESLSINEIGAEGGEKHEQNQTVT